MTTEIKQNAGAADDFDAAFLEAVNGIDTASTEKKEETPPADGKTAEQKTAEAEEARKAEETRKAEEDANRRAEEAARRVAAETETKRKADEEAARKAAEESASRKIEDPVLSDDDKKVIDEFAKEWPEQHAAMSKLVAHNLAVLEARVARTLVEAVGGLYKHMEPIAVSAATGEANLFRQTVLAKHADFDEVDSKIEPWIKAQPAYLQEGYMRVYNDGTAQELIDLIGRFKEASGVGTKVPETKNQSPASGDDKQAAAREEARKKAEALGAPVSGKRTAPNPQGSDPNNFDDAFASAAAQYEPAK